MKWQALLILLIIIVSLFPVYLLNKYIQKNLRPRESLGRLILYLVIGFLTVFIYTFLLVYGVKKLFPAA